MKTEKKGSIFGFPILIIIIICLLLLSDMLCDTGAPSRTPSREEIHWQEYWEQEYWDSNP